jgi:hypothetical protein
MASINPETAILERLREIVKNAKVRRRKNRKDYAKRLRRRRKVVSAAVRTWVHRGNETCH